MRETSGSRNVRAANLFNRRFGKGQLQDASKNQAPNLEGAHISKVSVNARTSECRSKASLPRNFCFLAEKLEQEKMDVGRSPREPQKRQRASPDVLIMTLADGLDEGETHNIKRSKVSIFSSVDVPL